MKYFLGIFMLICFIPTIIVLFLVMYPKNWVSKKVVLGVLNRGEFKNGDTTKKVDAIVSHARSKSLWILVVEIVLSVLLLLLPSSTAMMTCYCILITLGLLVLHIPYVKGNEDLKSLKRELGIEINKGVKIADLKSINASHALKKSALFVPMLLSVATFIICLLYDMKLINIGSNSMQGGFGLTIMSGSFLFVGLIICLVAALIDNIRNEIISIDSDVNANYNRAKKKIWADSFTLILWISAILIILNIISCAFDFFEVFLLIGVVIYMCVIMAIMTISTGKLAKLSSVYEAEPPLGDDDDYWKFGLFYYNPNDSSLNIKKRTGMGATINMAHPVGKIISIITIVLFIVLFAVLLYLPVLDTTEMNLSISDGHIICHQLRNDYKIPTDDIKEITFHEDMDDLSLTKVYGTGTENVLKGSFSVKNDGNCTIFMTPKTKCYLRIVTSKKTYYINDSDYDDTKEVYELLK